jgi:hypothetical protein
MGLGPLATVPAIAPNQVTTAGFADARLLERAGIPTRFVSLGSFGHGYPADMEERMREPMAWVAGAPDGS